MRHIWLSSPLLLVPGIRYCTRKYNVPTAAIGTLDQDRVANRLCQLKCILDAASFQGTTGDRWDLAQISQFAGSNLVAQGLNGLGGRANPHQSGFCDARGEIGVLGKEAVSGGGLLARPTLRRPRESLPDSGRSQQRSSHPGCRRK